MGNCGQEKCESEEEKREDLPNQNLSLARTQGPFLISIRDQMV